MKLPAHTFRLRMACGLLCLVGASGGAMAQLPAARVMSVSGLVKAVDAQGRERQLEKGSEVSSGEKIVTAEGALVQMRLNDGGYMSVRAGTEMVIDRFHYDEKNASNSNFLVSLVRGGFRSITGLIGKTNPDAYQIRTSTATVGIRGTDHEPMVIPEGVPGMAMLGAPGFYDKVNDGETFIRNRSGVLSLKRGEIGFAGVAADRAPQILPKVPDFYKVEVKTDARNANNASDGKGDASRKAADGGLLLRPSIAARREALATDATLDAIPPATATLVPPTAVTTVAPLTSTVASPAATVLAPSTSSLITPSTSLVSPTLATTVTPTTTLLAPVTTTVVPTTTLIAPTTTTLSPTTTIKSTILLK